MTLLAEIQTGPLAEELAPHVAIRHDAMAYGLGMDDAQLDALFTAASGVAL